MEITANGGQALPVNRRIWIAVFIFAFLGLMIDGADLMFLSYSLCSIKKEFGLTSAEAGMLGSVTLAGMAVGGVFGAPNEFVKKEACGADATASIKRSEFGMSKYAPSLGDDVKLLINVEAFKD